MPSEAPKTRGWLLERPRRWDPPSGLPHHLDQNRIRRELISDDLPHHLELFAVNQRLEMSDGMVGAVVEILIQSHLPALELYERGTHSCLLASRDSGSSAFLRRHLGSVTQVTAGRTGFCRASCNGLRWTDKKAGVSTAWMKCQADGQPLGTKGCPLRGLVRTGPS